MSNRSALPFIFLIITIIFFWKFFFQGLIPIPGDLIIGSYYPWLNSDWGYATGVPVKNPLMSDIVSQLYPWRHLVIDYLKQGQLPLWDPTYFLGVSLIGNGQAGIFNLFNILFWLPISFNYIWGLQTILQPLLAMTCMYVLLKHWKLSSISTLIGSLAYGLSGPLIVWMGYNVHGFAIAIFPLLFYFLEKTSENLRYWAGVSLTIASMIFAGYPQYLYYFLFFSFLYFCYFHIISSSFSFNNFLSKLALYTLFIGLGLGIAAVQLFPEIDTVYTSIRDTDRVAQDNAVITLPFNQLLMGLAPDFFGNPATYNYWGEGSYESFTFYTSIVAIILALWSIKNTAYRKTTYILIAFIVIAIFSTLPTPIVTAIQKLSWLGLKGSTSVRIFFVYAFAVSALAAIGTEYLLSVSRKKELLRNFGVTRIDVFPPAIITAIGIGTLFTFYMLPNLAINQNSSLTLQTMQVALRNLVIPIILTFSTCLVIFLMRSFNYKPLLSILIFLLLADMFRFGWKYLPFTKSELVFPTTSSISYLQDQQQPFRIAIEQGELLTANTWSPYKLESVSGYDVLVPKTTINFLSYLNQAKPDKKGARFVEVTNFNSPLLDFVNTRYFVSLKRTDNTIDKRGQLSPYFDMTSGRVATVFQEGPVMVLRNNAALDRFYTVDQYRVIKDSEQLFSYLISSEFSPQTEVVLTENINQRDLGTCQIEIQKYLGGSAQLATDCTKESLLVTSTIFHSGWKATVNQLSVQPLTANGIFMALPLPPGKSEVNFYFYPDSFSIGWKISLVSLVLLILILLYLKKKQTLTSA